MVDTFTAERRPHLGAQRPSPPPQMPAPAPAERPVGRPARPTRPTSPLRPAPARPLPWSARALAGVFGQVCLGVAVALAGLGLVGSFGLLSPIGVPILAIGLGVITAATDRL